MKDRRLIALSFCLVSVFASKAEKNQCTFETCQSAQAPAQSLAPQKESFSRAIITLVELFQTKGKREVLQYLNKKQAPFKTNTNETSNPYGKILHEAIIEGDFELVKKLIKATPSLVHALETFSSKEETWGSYITNQENVYITIEPVVTPLWAAQHACSGDQRSIMAQFLKQNGGTAQTALCIKIHETQYPSEGHAFYEVGGRSVNEPTRYLYDYDTE